MYHIKNIPCNFTIGYSFLLQKRLMAFCDSHRGSPRSFHHGPKARRCCGWAPIVGLRPAWANILDHNTKKNHLFDTDTYNMCACMWICTCDWVYMYIHPYKKIVSCIYSWKYTVLIGLFIYFSMFSLGVFRKVCLLQCFAPISGYVCALFSTHAPRGSPAPGAPTAAQRRRGWVWRSCWASVGTHRGQWFFPTDRDFSSRWCKKSLVAQNSPKKWTDFSSFYWDVKIHEFPNAWRHCSLLCENAWC